MSAFEIPHRQACHECGRPAIEIDDEPHCGNERCEQFGEVVGR